MKRSVQAKRSLKIINRDILHSFQLITCPTYVTTCDREKASNYVMTAKMTENV